MGRIVDLFAEVAAAVEEGPGGLVLPPGDWERLGAGWEEADIEDILALVRDSLLQGELVDSADSLSARLLDFLGTYGEADAFAKAQAGQAVLTLETIGHLARRVDRLEEILEFFRDGEPPDRRGFDELRRRLANAGIEAEMEEERPPMTADVEDEDA